MRRPRRHLTAIGVLLLAGACGDDRPSDAEWRAVWDEERDALPAADALLTGGEELCGDLLGRLRVDLPALLPTPTEALDDAVEAWIRHAESIAFDCPDDRDDLDERLDELDVLAAEIDAGLAADTDR